MNHYEDKQAARKERLEELAMKAEEKADSLYGQAKEMADVIPFG